MGFSVNDNYRFFFSKITSGKELKKRKIMAINLTILTESEMKVVHEEMSYREPPKQVFI